MLHKRPLVILFAAGLVPLYSMQRSEACFMRAAMPVQVWMDHINVDIVENVASKTYDCVFKNPNARAVVGGECYMELEPGTILDKMTVTVDGKEMEAEILDVKKACEVFQDIVRKGGSPALLEYYGNQLIRTKVPKIAPNGVVRVKLTYTTHLKPQGGLVRLQMLNTNPKTLMQKLQSAGVTINIKSSQGIQNVYSPTHPIKVVEKPDWDFSVEWSQKEYLPKHPFVLYYQISPSDVGAGLIAYQEAGEDGAFMLMLSPSVGTPRHREPIAPLLKDIVFCVDTSGSMIEGGKIEQAREALKYCLGHLRTGDRFNIVDFSTEARAFRDGEMVPFSEDEKAGALAYADAMHARGGTAIAEALKTSIDLLAKTDRLKMIVFATDGLPTIGEREPPKILQQIAELNRQGIRIFCFGEGVDVNTRLLDALALEHRGEADYILPEENITDHVSRFFDRVGTPVMTNLSVRFEGVHVSDVHPKSSVPDIFQGEQVILYGRYSGSGPGKVVLSGYWNGMEQTLEFDVEFPDVCSDDKNSFVPRLWAGQRVDFLLREIRRQEKPEQELVDEVIRLAKRYGIVTPYTSFLMGEDLFDKPLPTYRGPVLQRAQNDVTPGATAPFKRGVVEGAKDQAANRRSNALGGYGTYELQAEKELRQMGRDGTSSLDALRFIGNRTFYKRGEYWFDSNYDAEKARDIEDVDVGSPEYFRLVDEDGRVAKYFALDQVIVNVGGKWYRIQQKRG